MQTPQQLHPEMPQDRACQLAVNAFVQFMNVRCAQLVDASAVRCLGSHGIVLTLAHVIHN
jgi:hypothetical protein